MVPLLAAELHVWEFMKHGPAEQLAVRLAIVAQQ